MKAGEESSSDRQHRAAAGFCEFSTGNVHDQSDRMLRFLCRSGAANPASESDRMGAGRRTHVPAESVVRRHFLGTESFYHDGGRFSHADCVGNLNFTTIGQASSNDVFCNITLRRSGTVHFDGSLPENASPHSKCHAAVGINDNYDQSDRSHPSGHR